MAPPTRYTDEQMDAAVRACHSMLGKIPSIEQARRELGGGSTDRIRAAIKRLKAEVNDDPSTALLDSLREHMRKEERDRVRQELEEHKATVNQEARDRAERAISRVKRVAFARVNYHRQVALGADRERNALAARLDHAARQNATLQARNARLDAECAVMRRQIAAQEEQLALLPEILSSIRDGQRFAHDEALETRKQLEAVVQQAVESSAATIANDIQSLLEAINDPTQINRATEAVIDSIKSLEDGLAKQTRSAASKLKADLSALRKTIDSHSG